jgi:hypothetical protein
MKPIYILIEILINGSNSVAPEFMQEQLYITRLQKCTAEPVTAREANATRTAVQVEQTPNSAPLSRETHGSGWKAGFRSPMARTKESIFLLKRRLAVSSQEFADGIGGCGKRGKEQSRTVSLHRLAERRASQEEEEENVER